MIKDVTLKKCVEFAIATEELGAKFYGRLANKFSDNEEVKAIFDQLAKDEQIHKSQFKKLLAQTPADEGGSHNEETLGYLRAMSISEFFSHHGGPLNNLDQIQNRDEALKAAFELEKATLGFYRAVDDVLGPSEILMDIIETEIRHINVLMSAILVEGSIFRGLQDEWP